MSASSNKGGIDKIDLERSLVVIDLIFLHIEYCYYIKGGKEYRFCSFFFVCHTMFCTLVDLMNLMKKLPVNELSFFCEMSTFQSGGGRIIVGIK